MTKESELFIRDEAQLAPTRAQNVGMRSLLQSWRMSRTGETTRMLSAKEAERLIPVRGSSGGTGPRAQPDQRTHSCIMRALKVEPWRQSQPNWDET